MLALRFDSVLATVPYLLRRAAHKTARALAHPAEPACSARYQLLQTRLHRATQLFLLATAAGAGAALMSWLGS